MTAAAILTVNAGSSSIKFALFEVTRGLPEVARGQVESIGRGGRLLLAHAREGKQSREITARDHQEALARILEATKSLLAGQEVAGVGHRITHGGPDYSEPRDLDAATCNRLREIAPWAPLHQP